jgi:hypothetical protein
MRPSNASASSCRCRAIAAAASRNVASRNRWTSSSVR